MKYRNKRLVRMARKALWAPVEALIFMRAPIPMQISIARLTERIDRPLRRALLAETC